MLEEWDKKHTLDEAREIYSWKLANQDTGLKEHWWRGLIPIVNLVYLKRIQEFKFATNFYDTLQECVRNEILLVGEVSELLDKAQIEEKIKMCKKCEKIIRKARREYRGYVFRRCHADFNRWTKWEVNYTSYYEGNFLDYMNYINNTALEKYKSALKAIRRGKNSKKEKVEVEEREKVVSQKETKERVINETTKDEEKKNKKQSSLKKNKSQDDPTALLNLVKALINITNDRVKSLFSEFNSDDVIEFDEDRFLEYKKAFNEFKKYYKKLSVDDKLMQIKILNENINPNDLEIIFGKTPISLDTSILSELSPEGLINLINTKVKKRMLEGNNCFHYGQERKVDDQNSLEIHLEICSVTRYMKLEEIVELYWRFQQKLPKLDFYASYFTGLQENFALAIYHTLINRGYLKYDEKYDTSVLYEICTKILKDSKCSYTKTKNIDIEKIISTKEYDNVKQEFNRNNSFGRLKTNLSYRTEEKKNARKI